MARKSPLTREEYLDFIDLTNRQVQGETLNPADQQRLNDLSKKLAAHPPPPKKLRKQPAGGLPKPPSAPKPKAPKPTAPTGGGSPTPGPTPPGPPPKPPAPPAPPAPTAGGVPPTPPGTPPGGAPPTPPTPPGPPPPGPPAPPPRPPTPPPPPPPGPPQPGFPANMNSGNNPPYAPNAQWVPPRAPWYKRPLRRMQQGWRNLPNLIDEARAHTEGWDNPEDFIHSGEKLRQSKSHWDRARGTSREVTGHQYAMLQSESPFKAMSHSFRGVGAAVGNVPVVGKQAESMLKLLGALTESVDRLKKWNDLLHQSNMQFQEFSAAMSLVSAKQEVREILLSQERGNRRAPTADYQAEGKFALDSETAKFEDVWASGKNMLSGITSRFLADLISHAGPYAELLQEFINWMMNKGEGKDDDALRWLHDAAARSKDFDAMGRPKRFPR